MLAGGRPKAADANMSRLETGAEAAEKVDNVILVGKGGSELRDSETPGRERRWLYSSSCGVHWQRTRVITCKVTYLPSSEYYISATSSIFFFNVYFKPLPRLELLPYRTLASHIPPSSSRDSPTTIIFFFFLINFFFMPNWQPSILHYPKSHTL